MQLAFFSPVYWPTWIGLAFLRVFVMLPYPWTMRVGRVIGRIARRLPLHFVRVARRNLELCLPDLPRAERAQILNRHFEAIGMALCESAMTWWASEDEIRGLSRIEGLDNLERAYARGHGAILLTAHFTTLEISARILNDAIPVNVLYRPPKNRVLAWVAASNRARRTNANDRKLIERDDIRAMVRALRQNECVWYAPDQSYRKKGAAMVPFFGVPAATNLFTSRLAQMTGAAVLPYSHERLPDGRGYRVVIHPPLEGVPSDDPVADTLQYHAFIEREVRRRPDQYLWIHRRLKGLTAEDPDWYRRKAPQPARSDVAAPS